MKLFKLCAALALMMLASGCQSNCKKSLSTGFASTPHSVDDWLGVPRLSQNDSVLFAGQPTEDGFKVLADRGMKIVVNLRSIKEMQTRVDFDEAAVVKSLGMKYIHIPVVPSSFSSKDVDRLREVLAMNQNAQIIIHCASSNRVGGMWATYLYAELGFDIKKAIKYGKNAGLRSDSMISATKRVIAEIAMQAVERGQ